jgi:hypothetical protein
MRLVQIKTCLQGLFWAKEYRPLQIETIYTTTDRSFLQRTPWAVADNTAPTQL